MSDIQLEEKPLHKETHEDISMREVRRSKKVEVRKYEVDKKEISKNIQKFDQKRKVYTENPYSYNYVSLKKSQKITPTAEAMAASPLYNSVGKVLGLDTAKEWNQYYDKVYSIAEWAKKKVGNDDILKVIKFITDKSRTIPSMGARRIDDLYIHIGITK